MDWRLEAGIDLVGPGRSRVPDPAPIAGRRGAVRHAFAVLVLVSAPAAACTRPGSGRPLPAPPPAVPAAEGDRPSSGCRAAGQGRTFVVGPGKRYARLAEVPFETLRAGDTVQVAWRPEPYREKLMLAGEGTAAKPIRICGLPSVGATSPSAAA